MNNLRTIAAAAVLVGTLVSACGQRQAAEDTAAATASATPSDPAAPTPPPEPIIDLTAGLNIAPGVVHPIDGALLAPVETPMSCSVDSVNGQDPKATSITVNGKTQISGWIATSGSDPKSLVVLWSDQGSYAFANVLFKDRPDIAKAANIKNGSVRDFRVDIVLKGVKPGRYKVYFIGADGGTLSKCIGNEPLVIN
jgi:hypothetical protein